MASLTSLASTFLPRYSGVRPTISPARNTATIIYISMFKKPAPMPLKTTLSIMFDMATMPAIGFRLSCMLLTEPLEVAVVIAAQVALETGPMRTSLPSMFGALDDRQILGGGAGLDLKVDGHGDSRHQEGQHHSVHHRRVGTVLEHQAEHDQRRHRQEHDLDDLDQVAPGEGFSNGWVELGPKYPPPLVPICLTATSAATGPRLMVCVSILAAAPSIGVALTAPSKVIGIPLATSRSARTRHNGTKTKIQDPHQVDVEVAQVLVAPQAADHGQHDGQPRGRGDELEPDDSAELTEVTQVLLAGVVLEVGIGHERADGIEDHPGIGAVMLRPRRCPCNPRPRASPCRRGSAAGTAGRRAGRSVITNRAALNARKAKAYRFQSILAGSRRPSSRQRNIGRASSPRPARSADTSRQRNIHQPIGNDSAIGRPSAQNGCSQARFDPTKSPRHQAESDGSEAFRPEHGVDQVHQRGHGHESSKIKHRKDSQGAHRQSNVASRAIKTQSTTIQIAKVTRDSVRLRRSRARRSCSVITKRSPPGVGGLKTRIINYSPMTKTAQSRSEASTRPKKRTNRNRPRARVASAKVILLCQLQGKADGCVSLILSTGSGDSTPG